MSEEKKTGYNENRKKSMMQYAKNNLKRIPLDVQKSKYEEIKAAAAAVGESVNGYIKTAIDQRLQWNTFIDSRADKFPTTSDNDVVAYKYFPVDLDPVRPAGISSTEEELEAARQTAEEVASYMQEMGWGKYIFAFSGNGYHLLFPHDVPVEHKADIEVLLEQLSALFSNDRCKVDTTLYNPARIIKLYGTYACKGRSTSERPHRLSKILGVHDED